MNIEFNALESAMNSLREALSSPPKSDLERDGIIHRFKYSFELLWKTAKRVLQKIGIVSNSPRSVMRDLAKQGLIMNAELWLLLLEARNYTSHSYNEEVAKWVFQQSTTFLAEADDLISKLKAEI